MSDPRAKARQQARAKASQNEKLKSQIDSWFGIPLRRAVKAIEDSVVEVTKQLAVKEDGIMTDVRDLQDRMKRVDVDLDKTVKEEVVNQMSLVLESNEHSRKILECQVSKVATDLKESEARREKFVDDFITFERNCSASLEDMEHVMKDANESRETLLKLSQDFYEFANNLNQKQVYEQRLEFLVQHMASCAYAPAAIRCNSPQQKDRSKSLDRNAASTRSQYVDPNAASWQVKDGKAEWLPWPTPSKQANAPTAGSIRPSPPASRPSSARYRGNRGHEGDGGARPVSASSAGSGLAAARGGPNTATKPSRPTSASSVRYSVEYEAV